MPDLLVKLYDLENDWGFVQEQQSKGITIRKPLGTENQVLAKWVQENFGGAWASETGAALSNRPVTCFVAVKDNAIIGFGNYDATALGFFGPIGVSEQCRGQGTGKALLLACMLDMKLRGYGYAVIGMTDKLDFYGKCVGATVIPDSDPSVWKTWVK